MAVHLARRGPLVVWNRTAHRAETFAREHGAARAATPREVGRAATVVLTCLPTSADVEAVLDGPDGLLAGLSPGALLLDCTSGDPDTSRRLAERLAERGIAFADTPVSGGTDGARAAALSVMVGGTEEIVTRARPILEAFGSKIIHVGPVGAAHALKAVNNAFLGLHILALAEGLTTLVRAGVAPRTAVDVINISSGRSFVSERLVPERVLTGAWPKTFRLALLAKDAGIACRVASGVGVEAPILEAASAELVRAMGALIALGIADGDYLEVIKAAERRAGVELRG